MKKTERNTLDKAAKKSVKKNLQIKLVSAIKQSATEIGAETEKIEKQIIKGSNKLAKKIAKLIKPSAPEKKEVSEPLKTVKEASPARISKTTAKPKAVKSNAVVTAS